MGAKEVKDDRKRKEKEGCKEITGHDTNKMCCSQKQTRAGNANVGKFCGEGKERNTGGSKL